MQGVIEFWRAVEMFSPPSIPAVDASQRVYEVGVDEPLPWAPGHPLGGVELTKHQAWRHYVYVGTYQREEVFNALRSVFPPVPDTYEERPSGSSALLGLVLSEDGNLLRGSVVLSSCAWAMARSFRPGPGSPVWLDGFAGLEEVLAIDLEDTYLGPEQERRRPEVFDHDALAACRDAAIAALGIGADFPVGGIRVRSEIVARRSADTVEQDFLNSFIADDLARVAAAAGRDEVGAALRDYLRPDGELDLGRRIDVRTRLQEVRRPTDPDRVPLGRWPAAPDRPLALGQQLAVDEAVAMGRADEHVFAVNGPPGTGKTTMLRDLVAGLVTERAERLAALRDPRDAFVGDPHRWQTDMYRRVVHRLRPELTGFEMVVASSNNGAVENVTLNIPSVAAIDAPWRERAGEVDYFAALAERAMRVASPARAAPPEDEQTAWALVAARLGKAANRRDFANAVWWPEEWDHKSGRPKPPPSLRELLDGWEAEPEGPSWAKAVAEFRQARERVTAIRDERLRTAAALDRLVELVAQVEAARDAEREAHDDVVASRPRRAELAEAAREEERERRRLIEAREEEQARRPFVLKLLARVAWRERDRRLGAEIAAADSRLREIEHEVEALKVLVEAEAEATAAVARAGAAIEGFHRVLAAYREQPGSQLPDSEWREDRRERELRAPWSDEEWNRARTELFLASLALHRAFLVHAAGPMRQILDGTMDILAGRSPRDLPRDAVLAAWQALFLVVPVVSTTFASVGRLFAPLGPEALGWLLVDEAGQATPQSAVGALWRCRRAVIVGDPQQLEPITSIPFPLEQALRDHFGADEQWLTGRESAQSLADRLNRLGTTLPGPGGEEVWVGAPLTVHRRCDQPMFDLSNQIAYDGLMIDATEPALAAAFKADHPDLPESKWIDVHSDSSQGHWRPAEGVEVDRILDYLKRSGFDFSEVIAIAPFRDIARQLRDRRPRYPGLRAGTIHTAQGREADIVILVLGSDPQRAGARDWAASKPNLLNVAVSRARRRLYVIGDRDAWKSLPNFRLLAATLPHDERPRS